MDRSDTMQADPPGPGPVAGTVLAGVRVLDWTTVIAGPYCGQQLAWLGAEVTKVEEFPGDPLRWRGGSDARAAAAGCSTAYAAHARGRRLARLDARGAQTGERIAALLDGHDVLLTNVRRRVLVQCGLQPECLLERHPRLVVCTITGYGPGEAADWPAYDHTIQAASGLMSLTGTDPGGTRVGAPIVDYATGQAALAAILAALLRRAHTGRGGHVRVEMLSVALGLMSSQRVDARQTGRVPRARGNEANSGEPLSTVFDTGAGRLALAVNEPHQFERLLRALDEPRWAVDVRFATRAARSAHRDALRAAVARRLLERPASDWERHLNDAGVAAAAVRTLDEAMAHAGATHPDTPFGMDDGVVPPQRLGEPVAAEAAAIEWMRAR